MNNKITKIGITLRVEHIKKFNEKRDAISHDWVRFLSNSNILPIFIPNTLKDTKKFLEKMEIDGIILSGGDNRGDNVERDNTEKEIIELAIKNKIPLLGICRGMQVMNDYFGGNIVVTEDSKHVAKHHEVDLVDAKSQKLFETKNIEVNSFHNNIIKKELIGKNLEIFAISKEDNTVEGFYHKDFPFIGVMWHPEREQISQNKLKLMKIFYEKMFWED